VIQRQAGVQWYVNLPSAVAQTVEFDKGGMVEWIVEDKSQLVLRRLTPSPTALKKKRRT
jgi:hypothetical protein